MSAPAVMSNRFKRLAVILATTIAVIASLLTFPSDMPWMVAGWLLCHVYLVIRGKPGWFPLAACFVILLVKNVYRPWPLILLMALMLACGLWRSWRTPTESSSKVRLTNWICVTAVSASWLFFSWSWWDASSCSRSPALDAQRPIACLGDSLTSFGYPKQLDELIDVPVLNFGTDGITTADGVQRIPDLNAANPQVIVIELGGHDFLTGQSRAATKDNLQKIIDAAREIGAEVVLMEIPRGFAIDPFNGLERELAHENDLQLIPDTAIRQLVLFSPFAPPGMWLAPESHNSDDGLHPNARGNRLLAESVIAALESLYGDEIRSK